LCASGRPRRWRAVEIIIFLMPRPDFKKGATLAAVAAAAASVSTLVNFSKEERRRELDSCWWQRAESRGAVEAPRGPSGDPVPAVSTMLKERVFFSSVNDTELRTTPCAGTDPPSSCLWAPPQRCSMTSRAPSGRSSGHVACTAWAAVNVGHL
jgi:hypothetical protein